MSLSLTAVPFFFTGMLGGYIDVLFGSYMKYASFFLLQGLLHSGHGNLFAKKSILSYPFSKLVLNLRLLNKYSLQIHYYELFRTHVKKINKEINKSFYSIVNLYLLLKKLIFLSLKHKNYILN